jgi:hypothetical protein
MSNARRLLAAALLALAAVSCTAPGERPRGQGPGAPVATPFLSLTPSLAGTVDELRGAVAQSGYRLDTALVPYRPSEPASLADAPRTVLRASTPDTRQGFVVVYQLDDEATAAERAADLAGHVGSGFGQTNYPSDAQFHVAHVRDTVVFTWWSRAGAGDDAAAERVFEAVRAVGTEVPVRK